MSGYVVLETLEEDEGGWEPEPYTAEQRIARSAEGWSPNEHGAGSIFETKGPART